jgi:hypothetical protein
MGWEPASPIERVLVLQAESAKEALRAMGRELVAIALEATDLESHVRIDLVELGGGVDALIELARSTEHPDLRESAIVALGSHVKPPDEARLLGVLGELATGASDLRARMRALHSVRGRREKQGDAAALAALEDRLFAARFCKSCAGPLVERREPRGDDFVVVHACTECSAKYWHTGSRAS